MLLLVVSQSSSNGRIQFFLMLHNQSFKILFVLVHNKPVRGEEWNGSFAIFVEKPRCIIHEYKILSKYIWG